MDKIRPYRSYESMGLASTFEAHGLMRAGVARCGDGPDDLFGSNITYVLGTGNLMF